MLKVTLKVVVNIKTSQEGAKDVKILSIEDNRQITCVFSSCIARELLLAQIIF